MRRSASSRYLRLRPHVIDRPAALLLFLLLLPSLAIVAVVVRIVDGGPVLVRLPRMGKNAVTFHQIKFRTMRTDLAGGSITSGSDARVTTLGRWLRAHRIDELPQLVNIIVGDMTLIGPRPEALDYVDITDPRWRKVLSVAPGFAGPAQPFFADLEPTLLAGADPGRTYRNVILPAKLAVDTWYVDNASLAVDLLAVVAAFNVSAGVSGTSAADRLARRMPVHPHDEVRLAAA